MTEPSFDSIVILGLGAEAEGALRYFSRGAGSPDLLLYDDDPRKTLSAAKPAAAALATLGELSAHAALAHDNELWLRAPSMKPDHPALSIAAQSGRMVTTFTSFWIKRHRSSVLATITGTKGKSTATSLCGVILAAAGIDIRVAGNIGVVPDSRPGGEKWVFETSSFQLHDCVTAAPVHAVTSLYPEHLDWHGGMTAYFAAKLRPLAIDPACFAVLPRVLFDQTQALPNPKSVVEDIVYWEDGAVVIDRNGEKSKIPLSKTARERLGRDHILFSNFAVAVVAALQSAGLDAGPCAEAAARALETWTPLPSRQEIVGAFAGRIWVDDALATIPQATMAALQRWPEATVRLILGGKERHQDFAALASYLNARATVSVYSYGETCERLNASLDRPSVVAGSFIDALDQAYRDSSPADIILFSPAGATPEPGENYRTRSAKFRAFAQAKSQD